MGRWTSGVVRRRWWALSSGRVCAATTGDSLGLQSDTEGEGDVGLAISSVFDVYDWHDVRWKDVVAGFMVEAQRLVGRDDGQHDASVVVCRPKALQ